MTTNKKRKDASEDKELEIEACETCELMDKLTPCAFTYTKATSEEESVEVPLELDRISAVGQNDEAIWAAKRDPKGKWATTTTEFATVEDMIEQARSIVSQSRDVRYVTVIFEPNGRPQKTIPRILMKNGTVFETDWNSFEIKRPIVSSERFVFLRDEFYSDGPWSIELHGPPKKTRGVVSDAMVVQVKNIRKQDIQWKSDTVIIDVLDHPIRLRSDVDHGQIIVSHPTDGCEVEDEPTMDVKLVFVNGKEAFPGGSEEFADGKDGHDIQTLVTADSDSDGDE